MKSLKLLIIVASAAAALAIGLGAPAASSHRAPAAPVLAANGLGF